MSMLGSLSEHAQGQKGPFLPFLLFCKSAHMKCATDEVAKERQEKGLVFLLLSLSSQAYPNP